MAKPSETNFVGKRGETVFAFLIGKKCNGRFWFHTDFLDGKAEAKDFIVYCIEPSCYEATFFAQVKATSRGYTGKGRTRKLRVSVSEKDVQRLKRMTGPAFIVGIDIESEEGYLVPVTKRSRRKYTASRASTRSTARSSNSSGSGSSSIGRIGTWPRRNRYFLEG